MTRNEFPTSEDALIAAFVAVLYGLVSTVFGLGLGMILLPIVKAIGVGLLCGIGGLFLGFWCSMRKLERDHENERKDSSGSR